MLLTDNESNMSYGTGREALDFSTRTEEKCAHDVTKER